MITTLSSTLQASHLSKKFDGVLVLDDVSMSIEAGEIHGLLGENGSGKSTLIKILAGYYAPESDGELYVAGAKVRLPLRPGQPQELGMAFVHQDLALIPSLSVVENLRVGELASSQWKWHISWRKERHRAAQTFSSYGVRLDPAEKVGNLSQVQRALLAIVRAVETMRQHRGDANAAHGLLVLDEPTVFLPKEGKDQLFELVRDIVTQGDSVLFVSHILDEVLELTDRVTVLRDGRLQGTVDTHTVTEQSLVKMIIGRELESLRASHDERPPLDLMLRVSELTGGALDHVSLDLHRGEVLGLTGLIGSGFEEVPYFVVGARQADYGTLEFENCEYDLRTLRPGAALKLGLALVPANRQRDGSVGSLTVCDNIMLQVLAQYYRSLRLNRTEMLRDSRGLLDQFDVRPREPLIAYSSLSGGNQQKALMAKWLQVNPSVLVLHEPTQGVDVGARQQIFEMIRGVADSGTTVLCASADHEQLESICHRVLIFGRGKVMQQLVGNEITKDRLTEQSFNSMTLAEV